VALIRAVLGMLAWMIRCWKVFFVLFAKNSMVPYYFTRRIGNSLTVAGGSDMGRGRSAVASACQLMSSCGLFNVVSDFRLSKLPIEFTVLTWIYG
jgi:hypothetical protein